MPLRRSENIRKIENEYFVHCLVSWCSLMFKLLSEKMPVFKIEYLSSNNRFFRVGVLRDSYLALTHSGNRVRKLCPRLLC